MSLEPLTCGNIPLFGETYYTHGPGKDPMHHDTFSNKKSSVAIFGSIILILAIGLALFSSTSDDGFSP